MSEEFDAEFSISAITGLRAFRVDAWGRLRGVHQQSIIRPGVNNATHGQWGKSIIEIIQENHRSKNKKRVTKKVKKTRNVDVRPIDYRSDDYSYEDYDYEYTYPEPLAGEELAEAVKEYMLGTNVGFYSYYLHDESLFYAQNEGLAGVVANTGFVLSGDKGARSTKIEVLALAPIRGREKVSQLVTEKDELRLRLGHWAEKRPWLAAPALVIGLVFTLILLVTAFTHQDPSRLLWCALSIPSFLWGFSALLHVPPKCKKCRADVEGTARLGASRVDLIKPEMLAKVKANYPDVKFYNSVTEMLKHHHVDRYVPPPPPPDPTPETHDGFWDKEEL